MSAAGWVALALMAFAAWAAIWFAVVAGRLARNLDVTLWACRRASAHAMQGTVPTSPAVAAELVNLRQMSMRWRVSGAIPEDSVAP